MKHKLLVTASFLAGTMALSSTASANTIACLITKTDTNPFFVKMKEGAVARANELGVTLKTFAGRTDGDNETQVSAIETCIADGAKGILLTASDTASITSSVKQARDAGLVVIALDTPLSPADAADATFATDNFVAGELIGKWAKQTMGSKVASAKIAMLNINVSQPSVGVLRSQGFLQGFGVDVEDISKWGDETDPRVIGHDVTDGNEEGGRRAMENLLAKDQGIDVVYTINEPAAAGAYEALKAVGREKEVLIVSVDGGCPGVQNVKAGVIGATAQQYPLMMAKLGIEAIKDWSDDNKKPVPTPGKTFFDTGVSLITDAPAEGVPSIDSAKGADLCWG